MKKSLLMLAAALALTGCGSLINAVNAYGTVAIENGRAANDTLIAGWTVAACATPISAALRNPQVIPALRVLCMPVQTVAPVELLDALGRPGRE
jgi:hypothetical protein